VRSVVELDIEVSQTTLAELYTDPALFPQWMDDVERCELLSGEAGKPGSTFRLVPKQGSMVFVGRIIAMNLPHRAELVLDANNASVSVTGTLTRLSDRKTRLVSEEIFTFNGLFASAFGFFARPMIRRAHRVHMESFKRFAERRQREAR
jgi:uncharacterized protein YndB with AHSA1/START domain